jgi:hypothetical protein
MGYIYYVDMECVCLLLSLASSEQLASTRQRGQAAELGRGSRQQRAQRREGEAEGRRPQTAEAPRRSENIPSAVCGLRSAALGLALSPLRTRRDK